MPGILVEQQVVLHDQEAVEVTFQDGMNVGSTYGG
jgi:hypothetical protein